MEITKVIHRLSPWTSSTGHGTAASFIVDRKKGYKPFKKYFFIKTALQWPYDMAPDIFFRMWKGSTRRRSGTSVSNNYLSKKRKKRILTAGHHLAIQSCTTESRLLSQTQTNHRSSLLRLRDRSQVIFLTSFKVELL